jgi:hypothetical protein
MAYLQKRDYEKLIADCTELLKSRSFSGPHSVSPIPLWRGLAYANNKETLDKALADLTTFVGYGDNGDSMCIDEYYPNYWACLLRAAIRFRQNKSPNDLLLAFEDAEDALRTYRGPEAYALSAYIFEKGGFSEPHGYAAEIREAAKRDVQKPLKCEGIEANFAAAFRDTLKKLVPEIDKK